MQIEVELRGQPFKKPGVLGTIEVKIIRDYMKQKLNIQKPLSQLKIIDNEYENLKFYE